MKKILIIAGCIFGSTAAFSQDLHIGNLTGCGFTITTNNGNVSVPDGSGYDVSFMTGVPFTTISLTNTSNGETLTFNMDPLNPYFDQVRHGGLSIPVSCTTGGQFNIHVSTGNSLSMDIDITE